jgi:hypothetical protein
MTIFRHRVPARARFERLAISVIRSGFAGSIEGRAV